MNETQQLEMMQRQKDLLLGELLRVTLGGATMAQLEELHARTVHLRREMERFLEVNS